MRAEILRLGADAADVEGYLEFVRRSERIFAKGFTELATVPFLRVWDMVKIVPTCCAWRAIARSMASSLATFRTSGCARSCRSTPCWSAATRSRRRASTP